MSVSVFIVAAERSGDDLGAALIGQLRAQDKGVKIAGIGGAAMAAAGVSSRIDITPLSILGFTEAVKVYQIVMKKVRESVDLIMSDPPDGVVLIDSWGFMLRVAARLRKVGYQGKIIKYVAPQVFAMREGRAKVLANAVDHLLTIHSFDSPYFERHGLPVTYVGNPVFDTDYTSGNAKALRQKLNIKNDAPIAAVLFGSRPSEIERLTAPFADAVAAVAAMRPDVQFLSPLSETVATQIRAAAAEDTRLQEIIFLPEHDKFDVFAAASAALACSGTVTTQLACAGVPSVVAYKLSGLTYFFAKRMYKPDYISIVNIAANQPLMPEFVQDDCQGDILAHALLEYLNDKALAAKSSHALGAQTEKMMGKGGLASARAAETILGLLNV